MGIIVNRPAGSIDFPELLVQLDIINKADQIKLPENAETMKVLQGGLVDTGRGFVLHSSDFFIEDATLQIDDGICLTATVDILKAIAKGAGPKHAILALGYAGWAPGQLETEIQDNGWLHCDADPDLVFGGDVEEKYARAAQDRYRSGHAVERSRPRVAFSPAPSAVPRSTGRSPATARASSTPRLQNLAARRSAFITARARVARFRGDGEPDDGVRRVILRRLLRHRRRVAGDRRAAHVARLRLVVAAHPVHGLAIVPHHEIVQLSICGRKRIAGWVACSVRSRSSSRASGTGMPIMAPACDDRYSDLRPVHRMRAHQPLPHRLEHRLFFLGIVEEAQRAARVHQRMLADHVLDLGLGRRRRAHHRPRACRRIRCCRPWD